MKLGGLGNDKLKVEGYRRKKRRMKLKSKGNNSDAIIEKFTAQSSKSAKFAKTSIKKKDGVVEGGAKEGKAGDGKGNENAVGGGAM